MHNLQLQKLILKKHYLQAVLLIFNQIKHGSSAAIVNSEKTLLKMAKCVFKKIIVGKTKLEMSNYN